MLHLRCVGRTPLHGKLRPWLEALTEGEDPIGGALALALDRASDETLPPLDLAALAQADDAAGELARVLGHLEAGEIPGTLRERGVSAISGVYRSAAYGALATGPVPDPEPDGEAARDAFRRAGYRLLEALLRQKGEHPRP